MKLKELFSIKKLGKQLSRASVIVILAMLVFLLALFSDRFLTVDNLLNVAAQTTFVAIVAAGITLAMISGGIDLSVGSVAALAGALAAGLMSRQGLSVLPAVLVALVCGALMGFLNGLLIVPGRMPPFVATLATMAIGRGLTLVYTQGRPIAGLPQSFTFWGTGEFLGLPALIWVMLAIFILGYLFLRYTRFGVNVYAIGGNPEAARLVGIPVKQRIFGVYILSATLAALSGVLLTARLWSAQPQAAAGIELDGIAASVLGGVSLFGGVGNLGGTLAGALIIGILSNGLNLLRIPSYPQLMIKGGVFILAVVLDMFSRPRRETG
ncbi:MAG: ABC transporter permease [Chloroflexota bacterium]|nr:ABC transporter permease [Chloroflexota bacterium]